MCNPTVGKNHRVENRWLRMWAFPEGLHGVVGGVVRYWTWPRPALTRDTSSAFSNAGTCYLQKAMSLFLHEHRGMVGGLNYSFIIFLSRTCETPSPLFSVLYLEYSHPFRASCMDHLIILLVRVAQWSWVSSVVTHCFTVAFKKQTYTVLKYLKGYSITMKLHQPRCLISNYGFGGTIISVLNYF